jgi:hypothetical protein
MILTFENENPRKSRDGKIEELLPFLHFRVGENC